MTRMIYCKKLKEEAEGLDYAPYPGEIGQKIYAEISKKAWQQWIVRQTMLLNEHRLNTTDPQTKTFLATEMEKFLFGDGGETPAGYVPPK